MPSNLLNADIGFPRLNADQTADEKIAKITDYLYMLLEQLRYSTYNVDKDNFSENGLKELEHLFTDPVYARLENDEGDVAALFLTAQGLGARLDDAEGDVATLTLTASALTSRLTNAEGDISTLTQTASGLGTRLTNAEGDISTLTQTASGLGTRVTNAEGDISTLTQTASGLGTRLTSAEGNISTLTQTAQGLSASVSGLRTTTDALGQDVQTLESTTLTLAADGMTIKDAKGNTVTIGSGNLTAVTVTGATFYGGYYWDSKDQKIRLTIANSGSADFSGIDVYDNVNHNIVFQAAKITQYTGTTLTGPGSNHFLQVTNSGTYPRGSWDFSYATAVTGLYLRFT